MTVIPTDIVDITVNLTLPIHHPKITKADAYSYLGEYCLSLSKNLLVEVNSELVEGAIHLKEEEAWNVYIINEESEVDGVATFHFPLRFVVYEGECVTCLKQSIAECCYRLLIQSAYISVVSGCRVEYALTSVLS